ncbi:MAG: DUF1566 domain-containing protein [Treponema sp.]|nr:DUF1566 domain-containing protein [Treponema sp.]
MKSTVKQIGIIALMVAMGLFLVTCEGPMGPEGIQGEQGQQGDSGTDGTDGVDGEQGEKGEPGNTPWICVKGFWHIGGTPDACNENCTGITAGGTAGQAQLSITEPTRTTYCKDIRFNTAGLIVNFMFGNIPIPVPATNYVLIWNESLLTNGTNAISAETGTKKIYVLDLSGRIGEFEITVLEHAVSTSTPATCTTASAPGVCTNEHCNLTDAVTPALGHAFSPAIPATCLADSIPGTCTRDDCETEDTVVPALGHSFTVYNSNNNAACGIDGTKTSVCARDNCTETYTVTDTGSALTHSFSPTILATCTANSKPGICIHAGCGVTNPEAVVPALGHVYTWVVTTPPNFTTSTAGVKTCTCTICGESRGTQPIPIYALGDTGPAGGRIIYIAPTGFTMTDDNSTAYYLEAAPENMPTYLRWSTLTNEEYVASGFDSLLFINIPGTGTAIGTGRKNTALILALDPTAPAALACKDYFVAEYESFNDWFLPSRDELDQLHIRRVSLGRMEWIYWSSSQYFYGGYAGGYAWRQEFRNGGPSGAQSTGFAADYYSVRAVRAF